MRWWPGLECAETPVIQQPGLPFGQPRPLCKIPPAGRIRRRGMARRRLPERLRRRGFGAGFFGGLLLPGDGHGWRAGVGDDLGGLQLGQGFFVLFQVRAFGAVLLDQHADAVGRLGADAQPVLDSFVIEVAAGIGQRDRGIVAADFFNHAAIARARISVAQMRK